MRHLSATGTASHQSSVVLPCWVGTDECVSLFCVFTRAKIKKKKFQNWCHFFETVSFRIIDKFWGAASWLYVLTEYLLCYHFIDRSHTLAVSDSHSAIASVYNMEQAPNTSGEQTCLSPWSVWVAKTNWSQIYQWFESFSAWILWFGLWRKVSHYDLMKWVVKSTLIWEK